MRITNHVRDNPAVEVERAMDAARILHHLRHRVNSDRFKVLIETGYRTIDFDRYYPELAPTLQSYFTAICRPVPVDTANSYVLASLLECLPGDSEPKLVHAIRQSNNGELGDLVQWFRRYLDIAMWPLLRVFADIGISFEAHLQNTLVTIEGGLPTCFYVRDLEGVSVVRSQAQVAGWLQALNIDPHSSVFYSAEEAWHRTLYYFFVNHLGSLIHTLSVCCRRDEAVFWRLLVEELQQHLDDRRATPRLRQLLRELLHKTTLPAKANFRSCLQQRSERPLFVPIPNPILISRQDVPMTDFTRTLKPLETIQGWSDALQSPVFAQVEQRIIRQLIQALVFERLLPRERIQLSADGAEPLCTLLATDSRIRYRVAGERRASFGRLALKAQPVIRLEDGGDDRTANLGQFLQEVLGPDCSPGFARELEQTLLKDTQAQAWARRQAMPASVLDDYDELESGILDGHPYHPCYKSRIGFSLADNRRYGPEFRQCCRPVWLALDKRHSAMGHVRGVDYRAFMQQALGESQYQQFRQLLTEKGKAADGYWMLPVHLWQWREHIQTTFYRQLINEQIIVLGLAADDYQPQQSIRTLANVSRPQQASIKLALSIVNTSTSRVLASHTVLNGPLISDWLQSLITDDEFASDLGLILLAEEMGVTFLTEHDSAAISSGYGMLGAIWRQSIHRYLKPGESAIPLNAVCHLDTEGLPFIDPWVKHSGVETWVAQLLKVVVTPIIHLLYAEGIGIESHAQNIILVHRDGYPQRVALKDFHDGVRFSEALLTHPEKCPVLTPESLQHRRLNPQSFLKTDDPVQVRDFTFDAFVFIFLSEFCLFLHQHYQLEEHIFWRQVIDVIEGYQCRHPQHRQRFALFDLFADTVAIEKLTSRRIDPQRQDCFQDVENPLKKYRFKARER